jgi:hypothetical protein
MRTARENGTFSSSAFTSPRMLQWLPTTRQDKMVSYELPISHDVLSFF